MIRAKNGPIKLLGRVSNHRLGRPQSVDGPGFASPSHPSIFTAVFAGTLAGGRHRSSTVPRAGDRLGLRKRKECSVCPKRPGRVGGPSF